MLEKIESSQDFSSARLDKKLLRYLVESTLNEKNIKETTIAIDVFGKSADFNPGEDSSVRSHIYSVRKKLDAYYRGEGSGDSLRIVVPKGQYKVQFKSTSYLSKFQRAGMAVHLIWAAIVIMLFAILLLLITENRTLKKNQPLADHPVFSDFINSELPTMIVVGDYYFYKSINYLYGDISRIPTINSDKDLQDFLTSHPDAGKYMTTEDNSYFGQDVAFGLLHVIRQLGAVQSGIKIRLSSKVSYSDFRENNIIYLGSLKSLGIVSSLMAGMQIRYALNPSRAIVTEQGGDTTRIFQVQGSYPDNHQWTDYAISAKLPGSHNNTILIISTFNSWDSGTAADNIADIRKITRLKENFLGTESNFPQYFEILFEVNGYRRTSLSAEALKMVEIQ